MSYYLAIFCVVILMGFVEFALHGGDRNNWEGKRGGVGVAWLDAADRGRCLELGAIAFTCTYIIQHNTNSI